eukprot:TRINITY_DN6843_c0_g2_i1.p1 TRINITY_DN6843_c0_g2~~TRINITY_DN6843_c0_g2_i1.p1  ORF type:complete len:407 (+),score=26.90 TRINITY_DN6843_c0_g2_i1:80-1300(+)
MFSNKSETDKIIYVLHVIIFLYSASYWIQSGVLPFLTNSLNINLIWFGYLRSFMSATQLLGGPIFGRIGDVKGGRFSLILATTSSCLTYILLTFSYNTPLLFLSQIPSLFVHSMHGAKMIISKISTPDERSDKFGKLSISYGLGLIIGSFLSGNISEHIGLRAASCFSFILSLLSLLIIGILIPNKDILNRLGDKSENDADTDNTQKSHEKKNDKILDISKYVYIFKIPSARKLLLIRFFASIPFGLFESSLTTITIDYLGFSPSDRSYLIGYSAIVGIIGQGVILKYLGNNQYRKITASLIILTISFTIFSFLSLETLSLTIYFILLPLIIASVIYSTVITSLLTSNVPKEDQGLILGMGMSINSLVKIFSPIISSYLLEYYKFNSIGIVGSVFYTIAMIIHFSG